MTKSERLLTLLQLLRQAHQPVRAKQLSEQLSVTVRTIYRDIDSLRAQGADIQGEAGIGYQLKDGFVLPPLMFSIEEIEALLLGSRWVKTHADAALSQAAEHAMSKIQAVLPQAHRQSVEANTIFAPAMSPSPTATPEQISCAKTVRAAIRDEIQLSIDYEDAQGESSKRIIYPFALAFFDNIQVISAWCELRQDFRHFRVDRIITVQSLQKTYSPSKAMLLKSWQVQENICTYHSDT